MWLPHYEKVVFFPTKPQPSGHGSLIRVGTLKFEVVFPDETYVVRERPMFKTQDGREAFSSWWTLARDFGCIDV